MFSLWKKEAELEVLPVPAEDKDEVPEDEPEVPLEVLLEVLPEVLPVPAEDKNKVPEDEPEVLPGRSVLLAKTHMHSRITIYTGHDFANYFRHSRRCCQRCRRRCCQKCRRRCCRRICRRCCQRCCRKTWTLRLIQSSKMLMKLKLWTGTFMVQGHEPDPDLALFYHLHQEQGIG